ncbi:MAG TPA: NUDIX hydrolase [Blastocatellia bacterium]|jgi:ADP-ribose pyrophosphatase YjhB (NUDIX family)|nr:NUDIX hydrolase [Blastocatellia bacterium]
MMIRFDNGNNRFNYRVVGVAVHDNSVLLHRAEGDDFWTFPGGRAEFGEPAAQTLKREMREEIGVEVEVVRLLWFVENFFEYADMRYHEIALYFLMRLPATCKYVVQPGPFLGEEEGTKLTFQWFPQQPEALSGLPLLPSFLQTAIQKLPESVQHVIHFDE